ncbi:hypothetical protein [Pusillimonas sp. ANT_WB101]|uniref:hypothetical protein n=1 Tax=Pusillimonas sp. ANT_WB101 TaxID=2597356 RepID=UPI0011EF7BEA|nr:hypothetical protein [Pusillimonas sp. ANT_WB101]KAA0889935.1 hypothetical protein FQ179_16390 [Pusillimonas sp. ANT_WB101]
MPNPNNSGLFAWEAAAALSLTQAEFAVAVAAGKIARPHYDDEGRPRWEGADIGRVTREQFGSVSLHRPITTVERMNKIDGRLP